MSVLILNGEHARTNIDIDRRIFAQFNGYTLQYVHGLPDRLFLADPWFATMNAIVLVDITERNIPMMQERSIYIDFYHPTLLEPMRIVTTDDFSMVIGVEYPDEHLQSVFGIDPNDPPSTDAFFDNLLENYEAYARVDDTLAASIARRHTLDVESVQMQ